MSSDGYFDGDDLDDEAFEQLDAIEAALLPSGSQPTPNPAPPSLAKERSFYDLTFDIDEAELQKLDDFIEDAYRGNAKPVVGPSRTASKETYQTTLFGDILPQEATSNKPRSQIQRTRSISRNPFGQQAPKTKQWDRTAFAKSGLKARKSKGKDKARQSFDDEDEDDEALEFEQFPAPFVSVGPPPPMKLSPDLLEAKHWIYPVNQPKRDYQYNIVKHCLFENTIVALPTGLGKTFIAGVVMLNFYRWFPGGKVVFVAPTKPLVAQQIEACHRTCGIPGGDAVELTGQVPKVIRGRAWKEKRVFYMTPQTLVNDLTTENCDVRDIILLVIDEAHRATGDYAYNQVIRFLMAKNPHFRVLALTATPGGTPEAVQTLIDGLHISRIEIRDENSLDLKSYIYHKTIEQHIIAMSEDVNVVKDLLAKLMETILKPLRQRGVLWGSQDPANMHPYAAQARMGSLSRDQKWAYGPLSKLSSLARAMGYLIEGTMGMCYTYLQELSRETHDNGESGSGKAGATSKAKTLRNDPLFQATIRELEVQRSRGFSVHPKMDRLKALVVQHFAEKLGNEGSTPEETRVMVFVTFREAVDEIVEALNFERPLVRASKFVGQGLDKQGKKGLAQKEQLEIIKKFKAGEINVLVATSIGEEGLDIGEVDLIVCYDAQKTPIRMLQRLGRTGRKRAGVVHVLLSEGREEFNLDKAKDTYKEVQKTIWRGEHLELYADVERLLPQHVKPECLEKRMEIQEYIRDEGRKKGAEERGSPVKGVKRKRNDDISRNIPTGASTGFVSVAELLIKGTKKRKKPPAAKDFDLAGEDDDTDMEIESGLVMGLPRRTKSTASATSKSMSGKARLRRASTMDGTKGKKRKKKNSDQSIEPTSSQFSNIGIDDADDLDIEQGMIVPQANPHIPQRAMSREQSSSMSHSSSPTPASVAPHISDADSDQCTMPDRDQYINSPPHASPEQDRSMAWLVDDDDDERDIEIIDSSPLVSERRLSPARTTTDDESIEFMGPASVRPSPAEHSPLTTDCATTSNNPRCQTYSVLDESIEFVGVSRAPERNGWTGAMPSDGTRLLRAEPDESIEFIMANSVPARKLVESSPKWYPPKRSPAKAKGGFHEPETPLSSLSQHFLTPPSEVDSGIPEPSFPVRPVWKQTKKRIVLSPELDSPVLDMPPPSQRRLHRYHESSPIQRSARGKRSARSNVETRFNPVFDIAAIHSGDETSEGSSNGEEDVEDESDRLFLAESPETQVSSSYDQSLAYRQSLFTQAPVGAKAPAFAKRPVRHGAFGGAFDLNSRRRRTVASSSPVADDDEPDEYAFGSFVVDDEAEISYLSSE